MKKLLIILILGLVVRLILSPFGTLRLDQNTFIAWSNILAERGFSHFYNGWSDYLPGYLYILWFLVKIKSFLPIPEVLVYKLPAILVDLAVGFFIFKIVSKLKNSKWGLVSASLYIFNPAILANSTLWGQVDSLTALFSLLPIYLVGINPYFSAVALSIGTLIKPQTAFIAPVILLLAIKDKWKIKQITLYIIIGLSIFVAGFIPFSNGNLIQFIINRIILSAGQYPYTSINAFNFWGLFGLWRSDTLITQLLGLLIFGIISLVSIFKIFKRQGAEYLLAAIVLISSFLFLTRMHERHFLPAFVPLLISSSILPTLLIPYVGFSITYIANLYYSYNWISNDFVSIFSQPVIKIFIFSNLILTGLVIYKIFNGKEEENFSLRVSKFKAMFNKKVTKIKQFKEIKISPKTIKILLAGILIFAFVTRIFQLQNPPNEYFDEVYHAFTARQILHGNPKAWEWWNTPPKGFAYEWTHPPLAKLGMVLGMLIFGENSFGWRIPGALLGVGSVLLIFLIAKELFKDELVGIFSAVVFSLDGLPLVMSRIGMNDTYFLFFILLSIYFFIKGKDFSSAAAFGLSLSSKWSAIWAIPILGLLWLRRKNRFSLSILWFLILPFAIYLLSYLPMFLSGHGLDIFWGMQKQMWWYHTGLKATHPYTSSWWSWPFMIRPVYLYTSEEIGGWVSRIYAIGNPAIFWGGLVSIIVGIYYAFIERNKNLALVVFSYLVFFVPWAASPRIMFLYHYLPSLPFSAIATGYVLRRNSKLAIWLLGIGLLVFIYFYPHWAGLNIPIWLDKSYYWFTSWR
jgi:dolichyl-phosphate-mannose-protein mannosyltransferase